jgi:hypothetical protein
MTGAEYAGKETARSTKAERIDVRIFQIVGLFQMLMQWTWGQILRLEWTKDAVDEMQRLWK